MTHIPSGFGNAPFTIVRPLFSNTPVLQRTGNVRATGAQSSDARSESAVAIDPRKPKHMIGASKRFLDPAIYWFDLKPIWSRDGGQSWHESTLPMQPGWDGMTDPTVAFDDHGNAYLVGEPLTLDRTKLHTGDDVTGHGMQVYRSTDGGQTWEQPRQLTTDTSDDKQWVACDNTPTSPHYGNVYVVWGASTPLRFARSSDQGVTWRGPGGSAPGEGFTGSSYAPDISVGGDGTIHIAWHDQRSTTLKYVRSTDGGDTFTEPIDLVTGVKSLWGTLPTAGGWPVFPGSKFRVITLASTGAGSAGGLFVAWADMRDGVSRIYTRRSLDSGATWDGPATGTPLLPESELAPDWHCFHPQVAITGSGVIGCAFYVLAPVRPAPMASVKPELSLLLAASRDDGASFPELLTVSEQPWDPHAAAPLVHGMPDVEFIGEYFGLDADDDRFALLWTDTRTQEQQLWSDVVITHKWVGPKIPQLISVKDGVIKGPGPVEISVGALSPGRLLGTVRKQIGRLR